MTAIVISHMSGYTCKHDLSFTGTVVNWCWQYCSQSHGIMLASSSIYNWDWFRMHLFISYSAVLLRNNSCVVWFPQHTHNIQLMSECLLYAEKIQNLTLIIFVLYRLPQKRTSWMLFRRSSKLTPSSAQHLATWPTIEPNDCILYYDHLYGQFL